MSPILEARLAQNTWVAAKGQRSWTFKMSAGTRHDLASNFKYGV